MFGIHFFLVFVLITNRDLAGRGVDENIRRMREARPFLNVVVADESKDAMLRKTVVSSSTEPSLKRKRDAPPPGFHEGLRSDRLLQAAFPPACAKQENHVWFPLDSVPLWARPTRVQSGPKWLKAASGRF